jgi:hypothetical protein
MAAGKPKAPAQAASGGGGPLLFTREESGLAPMRRDDVAAAGTRATRDRAFKVQMGLLAEVYLLRSAPGFDRS